MAALLVSRLVLVEAPVSLGVERQVVDAGVGGTERGESYAGPAWALPRGDPGRLGHPVGGGTDVRVFT